MIENSYLKELYEYNDIDTSINQLLEITKTNNKNFLESLNREIPDLNVLEKNELTF